AYTGWSNPRDVEQHPALVLVLQMFVAATGYRVPARRGHFDPLLTAASHRRRVAQWHWLWSMAPGLVAWLAVAFIMVVVQRAWPTPLELRAIVAFFFVSTAAWAISLPLVEHGSGVLWLIVLIVLAGTGRIFQLRGIYLNADMYWTAVL